MVKLGVGEHWPEEKQSPADKLLMKQPLDSTRIFALDNLSERQNKFSAEVLVKYLFIYSWKASNKTQLHCEMNSLTVTFFIFYSL